MAGNYKLIMENNRSIWGESQHLFRVYATSIQVLKEEKKIVTGCSEKRKNEYTSPIYLKIHLLHTIVHLLISLITNAESN